MASMPHGAIDADGELSVAEKFAIIAGNLPTAVDYRAFPVRAVSFTRQAAGSMRDLPAQQAVFTAACAAREWSAGGSVGQIGEGFRAWQSVIRMVRIGRYDVVVVDTEVPLEACRWIILSGCCW